MKKDKPPKHIHGRRSSDSKHPLLDSRMDEDPNQPTVDYSKIATSMQEMFVDDSDDGNPFSDAHPTDTITQSAKSIQRRPSLSIHRTSTINGGGEASNTFAASTPTSPHRRSSSSAIASKALQGVVPISSNSSSGSDSYTATNRLKRSPSTPISGQSDKQRKEAQLESNFLPAAPSAFSVSPRNSTPSIMQRPIGVADLNTFSDDKQFTKKNIYFNLVNQIQLSVSALQDDLTHQIAEFATYQDTQMRAINQRHSLLVTLLADVSRGDIIKVDSRGNYNGTENHRPEPSCGCFSMITSLFDATEEEPL